MDALLRTLQLGFILRSLFAGIFFVVAYRATRIGFAPLATPTADGILTTGLPVAVCSLGSEPTSCTLRWSTQ